ncbi:hypothetical protein AJ80_10006 [Polytolypa hystricis UAMH7299]|uniref:Uncharacterized protein n=1 Tax=Polytolypa hystricis (strain UAMH7299) TaxID=1447883 RepID=A0A2B7WFB2_POLH7|nr:hypothetical protein AJ80_10006 [Polytolypa hystricis UAMH7299]
MNMKSTPASPLLDPPHVSEYPLSPICRRANSDYAEYVGDGISFHVCLLNAKLDYKVEQAMKAANSCIAKHGPLILVADLAYILNANRDSEWARSELLFNIQSDCRDKLQNWEKQHPNQWKDMKVLDKREVASWKIACSLGRPSTVYLDEVDQYTKRGHPYSACITGLRWSSPGSGQLVVKVENGRGGRRVITLDIPLDRFSCLEQFGIYLDTPLHHHSDVSPLPPSPVPTEIEQ